MATKFKYWMGAFGLATISLIFLQRTQMKLTEAEMPYHGKLAFQKQQASAKSGKEKANMKSQKVKTTAKVMPQVTESIIYDKADLIKRIDKWEALKSVVKSEPRVSRLCDSIVIGVRKCGTGALLKFLGNHPLIRIPPAEIHYYDQGMRFDKGLDYYKNMLPNASSHELLMEKTPAYFQSSPEDLPSIIDRDSPGVKVIVTLCDPVNRVLSEYARLMYQNETEGIAQTFEKFVQERFSIDEKFYSGFNIKNQTIGIKKTLKNSDAEKDIRHEEEERFVYGRGIYIYNIRRWMKAFGPDRFLIVDGNNLLHDPGLVMERVQRFLKIPVLLKRKDFIHNPETGMYCLHRWWSNNQLSGIKNSKKDTYKYIFKEGTVYCLGKEKGRTRKIDTSYFMSPAIKERLESFYRPFNTELFSFLNRTFKWAF